MQIFSISHTQSSRSHSIERLHGGFTLIELLISTAIISLLTVVVIVRFSVFDSTVLLKSLAYEIAISLREAQSYSLSVLGSDEGFRVPYGVAFKGGSQDYSLYFGVKDETNAIESFRQCDPPTKDCEVKKFNIGRSMQIEDVCVNVAGGTTFCGGGSGTKIKNLDIAFKRPEFRAYFSAQEKGGGSNPPYIEDSYTIESAEIKVSSTRDSTKIWIIEIGLLGSIYVHPE